MTDSWKKEIRIQQIAARRNISLEQREKANNIITEKLQALSDWKNARTVCVYMSLPEEVDTKDIVTKLFAEKKLVVVPKVGEGGSLTLHTIRSMDDLTPGAFGILEPHERSPIFSIDSIDLFIIPGVAFDRTGHRLGWGKGYYDRLLKNISIPRIALAYAIQVIAQVPHSSYDVSMTNIITNKEVIICQ